MNEDLRKALSSIEGVEGSEVDLIDDGPLGIRIRLAPQADRRAVAASVQRLLEAHGLRSRVAPDRRTPGPDRPPAPPPEPPGRADAPGPVPGPRPPTSVPAPPKAGGGIEAVTVTETLEGVVVSVVASDGRAAVRRARRTEQALHEALVSAVAELVDPESPPAGLRGIEHSDTFAALTVYLEVANGSIRVGAAAVSASNPFAFAQAVWLALQP